MSEFEWYKNDDDNEENSKAPDDNGGFQWDIPQGEEAPENEEPQENQEIEPIEEEIKPAEQYLEDTLFQQEELTEPEPQQQELETIKDDKGFFGKALDGIKKTTELAGNTADAWSAWSLRTTGGLLSSLEMLPALAYDTTANLIQNPIADLLGVEEMKVSYEKNVKDAKLNFLDNIGDKGAIIRHMGNEISPLLKTDGNFESNLKEGNYGEAAEQLYYMINENLPQILIQLGIASMTGGMSVPAQATMLGTSGLSAGATTLTGLGMIGLSKSGGEYSDLKEEGKLETQNLYNNAVIKGFSEIAASAVFSQPYFNHMFATKGSQAAFIKALNNKAGRLVTGITTNTTEENLVNIIDNFADNLTGNYDEEEGKIPLTQGWLTTTAVSAPFGALTGTLDIYLSDEQRLKRQVKKVDKAIEETLKHETPVEAIKAEVNKSVDEEINENLNNSPVEETSSPESDIIDSQEQQQGEVVSDAEGRQQETERYRQVLQVSKERAEAEGILPENNREAYEANNDAIAENTIKQHEPMTEEGSFSFEVNNSELYYDAVSKAKEANEFGQAVDTSNPEDLANKRLFLYAGGAQGFAIEADGNITNVFKNPELTTERGSGHEMMLKAIKEGGDRLDFYDGYLTTLYGRHGFVPVSRTAFNTEFAPDNWNYERDGQPDVVFGVHNGDSVETVKQISESEEGYSYDVKEAPLVEDYDAGKAIQTEQAEGLAEQIRENTPVGKLAKESLTEQEFLTRLIMDEEVSFDEHDIETAAEARQFWQQVTKNGTEFEVENRAITTESKLEKFRNDLDSLDDNRTKEARDLKQKISNLEKVQEYEDFTTNRLYEELNSKKKALESIDDKRTQEARELKDEVAAIDSLIKQRKVEAIFEKQVEQQAAWMRRADETVKKELQQYKDDMLENGVKVTPEQEQELTNTIKPSKGYAINTTRIIGVDAEVKQLTLDIAKIAKNDDTKTIEDLKEDAAETFNKENIQEVSKQLGILEKDAQVIAKLSDKMPDVVYRLREVITSNAKVITETANLIKDSSATLSEQELAMFGQRVAVQETLTNNLDKIVGNTARTTSLQRAYVSGEMIDMYDMTPQQFIDSPDARAKTQDILDSFGGRESIVSLAENIVKKVEGQENLTNPVNETVRESKFSANLLDALIEYRSSNVLMNMSTHFTNIISQTGRLVMDDFIDFIGATYNAAIGYEDAMTYGKARAQLIGNLEGIKDAFTNPIVSMKEAGEFVLDKKPSTMDLIQLAVKDPNTFEEIREATVFTKGRMKVEGFKGHSMDSTKLLSDSFNEGTLTGFIGTALDYYGAVKRNIAFGGLQGGDAPFAHAGFYRELAGQLYDIKQGMPLDMSEEDQKIELKKIKNRVIAYRKLKTLEPYIERQILVERAHDETGRTEAEIRSDVIEEHIGDSLRGVTPEQMEQIVAIDAKAGQYSEEVTWKDSFDEGTFGKSIETLANNHRWIKLMQMFIHTPAKIFAYAYDNTISPDTWSAIKGKKSHGEQIRALSGVTASALVMAAGALLYSSNHLTPAARDRKERERMYQAGVVPNSFRIGDKWYSYNRIEPMSYYLSMAASASRAVEEVIDDTDDSGIPTKALRVLGDTSISMVQTMLGKSYFKGLTDLASAVTGDGSRYYAENFVSSLEPMYSFKRNIFDYAYGGANPFYREHMVEDSGLVRRDIFGKPIVNWKSPTGLNPTEMTKSPIRQELYDLELNLSGFGRTLGGVTISEQQRYNLLEYFDEEIKAEEQMNKFIQSSSYQNIQTIEQKQDALRSKWLSLKSGARKVLYTNPEFLDEFIENKKPSTEVKYPKNMFKDKGQTNAKTSSKPKKPKEDIVETINMFKGGE